MNRRGFLRTAVAAAAATVGAMIAGKVAADVPALKPGAPLFFGANSPAWASLAPPTGIVLERAWRMANDADYRDGRGLAAIFPEYDRANYQMMREETADGWYDYFVWDCRNARAGTPQEFHPFLSTIREDQELTARAAYVEVVARLRRDALDADHAAMPQRRAEDDAIFAGALAKRDATCGVNLPVTTLRKDTLTQSVPWTSEQMTKVLNEYRALPDVFHVHAVASGPRESGMYTISVFSERSAP